MDEKTRKILNELSLKSAKRLAEYEKSLTERNDFIDGQLFKPGFAEAVKKWENDGRQGEPPCESDYKHIYTNRLNGISKPGELIGASDLMKEIENELEAGRKEFVKNYKF